MATSSLTPPSSPFPKTPVALARPSTAAVRSTNYDNYNQAFSEDTSYSNTTYTPATSSPLSNSISYTSRTVSAAFGKQVLSAISENVKSQGSLSRTASLHARARSLVSFVPALNPTDTEEQHGSSRSPPRKGPSFTDIFTPRRSSLAPSEPEEESEYIMSYKSSFTGGSGRIPEPQAPAPKPTGIRSFSWFGSTKNAPVSPLPTQAESTVGMDILTPATSLLFPVGLPSDKTPATFDELLHNAEFLINRLQTAYKEQSSALQAARAEREAQTEETEEASTRAQHLKLQLENLAAVSAEQAATNRALAEELAAEKQRRHEDREHYERLARQNDLTPRRNRHSDGSSMHSDSGFESEADTAESCSRPLTPTSPNPNNYTLHDNRWSSAMEPIKEVVRPVSRDSTTARIPGRTCEIDAGVYMFMRDEKVRLERRVQELEGVLDGCLDLIA
ncbi:hypothetical protein E4T52_07719 [Aureobasidium sp. EXF-3400]|nr:hypothetical protein E4T51_02210 [Aureobasidium sp. EXF-12344]KAI4777365.1 hypothetical protein E4T52_07719 [Aureobasidium sp. EXF-3400]